MKVLLVTLEIIFLLNVQDFVIKIRLIRSVLSIGVNIRHHLFSFWGEVLVIWDKFMALNFLNLRIENVLILDLITINHLTKRVILGLRLKTGLLNFWLKIIIIRKILICLLLISFLGFKRLEHWIAVSSLLEKLLFQIVLI